MPAAGRVGSPPCGKKKALVLVVAMTALMAVIRTNLSVAAVMIAAAMIATHMAASLEETMEETVPPVVPPVTMTTSAPRACKVVVRI
jgi:hypothetical protein